MNSSGQGTVIFVAFGVRQVHGQSTSVWFIAVAIVIAGGLAENETTYKGSKDRPKPGKGKDGQRRDLSNVCSHRAV